MKWKDWVHVTKLDPDKQLKPGDIDAIASSGTDALMLSGTLNVTKENLAALQKQVKAYDLPLVMEPAGPDAVLVQGIDYVFVPSVLNTSDVSGSWASTGHGCTACGEDSLGDGGPGSLYRAQSGLFGRESDKSDLRTERKRRLPRTRRLPITISVSRSCISNTAARSATRHVVKAASEAIDKSVLYYGGGINSAEKAAQMSMYADTIVVGNAVYDQGASVLKATVDAVQ